MGSLTPRQIVRLGARPLRRSWPFSSSPHLIALPSDVQTPMARRQGPADHR